MKEKKTTSRRTWQKFESRVAKDFHATKTNQTVSNKARESCDCISDVHFIECKLRAKWPTPADVRAWWKKLDARVDKHGPINESGLHLIPLLCIQHKGKNGYWIVREIPNESGLFWQHSSEYFLPQGCSTKAS